MRGSVRRARSSMSGDESPPKTTTRAGEKSGSCPTRSKAAWVRWLRNLRYCEADHSSRVSSVRVILGSGKIQVVPRREAHRFLCRDLVLSKRPQWQEYIDV